MDEIKDTKSVDNFFLYLISGGLMVFILSVGMLCNITPKFKVVGSNYRCEICEASYNRAEMYKKFYEECSNSKDTVTIRDTIKQVGYLPLPADFDSALEALE